ncbi:asparaginase [Lapillicoccus sp.]|uniref:asparaginase n=1 Tax=Lapillicoccus sp. TaxID=1909287 RepID=UPI0032657E44
MPGPRSAHAAPDPLAVSPLSTALTEAPILAHVVRSGIVESVHRGTVVVTAPDGSLDWALGDPSGSVLARSSNKPLQAAAMVRLGLDLPHEQLALACASHSGEPFHLEAARGILAGAGLSEADLQNTPDYPIDEDEREAWVRASRPKASIAQNCSGKHAGMLATCAVTGWDTATYRDPEHPLQRHITETVAELSGEPVTGLAVDGCGAPLHAYALIGLARAFGRVASASTGPESRVADAIRAQPLYLGGTQRQVTMLVREAPGLVAKDGAESVYAVGLADGRGVAVKVADGFPRAAPVVLAAVLSRLGVQAPTALAELAYAPVLGHGDEIGAVVAVGF